MAKVVLSDVTTLANTASAKQLINDNSSALESALENTLSRDGTGPNAMAAELDMGDHKVLNVADPVADADAVNLRSVRPLVNQYAGEIAETIIEGTLRVKRFFATAGQTDFQLDDSPGTPANAMVFDSGVFMYPGTDYTLSGASMDILSFFTGRAEDAEIVIRYVQLSPADGQLRADLNNPITDRGSDIVQLVDVAAPAYLKTISDIINGEPVNILRNIPRQRWAGIQARTDTEDTADAIMDLMDAVFNPGAKQLILRVPLGTFTIHKPIQRLISSGHVSFKLIGDDWRRSIITRGSDWSAGVGTGSMFNISGIDGHSIERLRLIGNATLYPVNANHGISTSNSNHVIYRDLYIEDWKNSGILVFHFPGTPEPGTHQEQNNLIEHCYLAGNGAANNGVLMVDQYYSHINNVTVRDLGKSGSPAMGVQFKNNTYMSTISNCIVSNARAGIAFGEESVTGEGVNHCVVSNCTIRDCVWGIQTGKAYRNSFNNINIHMEGQGSNGIELNDSDENVFTAISLRGQLVGSGAYSVDFQGDSDLNHVEFAELHVDDAIPEIAKFESTAENNVVRVRALRLPAPLTYSAQGKLDENATPSGNSLVIDGYATQGLHEIAAGVINIMDPATEVVRVNTEASAATDDLVTINGNGRDSQRITVKSANSSRDVTVKHGTGNIVTKSGADVLLDTVEKRIELAWEAGTSKWVEV